MINHPDINHHDEILSAFSRLNSSADLLDQVIDNMTDNPLLIASASTVAEAIRCFAEQGTQHALALGEHS